RYGKGLKFKVEEMENSSIEFLDLKMFLSNGEMRTRFEQRSKKTIVPFSSAHSKLVKRNIVSNLVKQVVMKSSSSEVENSWRYQSIRLQEAGYPDEFIKSVLRNTLNNM